MVMVPAFVTWARLLLFPLHLSADYAPNAFTPGLTLTTAHLAGVVLLAAVGGATWWARRRLPALTFAIAWIAITASVAANIIVPTGVLLAERVLYLPSVGAAIAIGALWERLPRNATGWAASTLVLALLAARTLERIPVWREQERFYQALIHDAPDSYHSHWARGARAFDRGDARAGEREYFAAIRIHPEDAAVVQELGERYLALGLFASADRFLTAAYRADSLRSDAALQAVMARTRMGRPDSAVALGEVALRRFPDIPTLLLATSDAYLALGRPLHALVLRRRITYLVPLSWQYQHIAAFGAAMAGRCDEARARLDRAIAMAPAGEEAPRRFLASVAAGPTCGQARP
jgi:tetratricopeptide (TPR) repeat protein